MHVIWLSVEKNTKRKQIIMIIIISCPIKELSKMGWSKREGIICSVCKLVEDFFFLKHNIDHYYYYY